MEETIPLFDPKEPLSTELNHEWVVIGEGKKRRRLCVREMEAGDSFFIEDRLARPGGAPAALSDRLVWPIVVSCYNGDGPEAERIFGMDNLQVIPKLKVQDIKKILAAIARVNGTEAEEIPRLQDFTGAVGATNSR